MSFLVLINRSLPFFPQVDWRFCTATPPRKRGGLLLICLLTVLFGSLNSVTAADQKLSAAVLRQPVCLDLQKQDSNSRVPGILVRELFRQAFLIAARDELGYRTRDVCLGDQLPPATNGDVPVFNINVTLNRRRRLIVQVMQKEGDKEKLIEKRDLKLTYREPVQKIASFAEEFSRTWFKDLLQQAGYVPQKRKAASKAVAAKPARFIQPDELNYRDQFTRLIDTHRAIAEQGESPARLATLAQSYALYGTLTEQYWSRIPQATKARALLYAERLQTQYPQSASGLSCRALVSALVGLDQAALQDLKTISGLPAAQGKLPEWLPVVEAHCRYSSEPLAGKKLSPESQLLRDYLKLLEVTYFGTPRQKNAAADAVLKRDPRSTRAFYTRGRTVSDRRSLAMIHDANVELIHAAQPYIKGKNTLRLLPDVAGTELPNLLASRDAIVADLYARGTSATDRTEPSFSLLANTVQELTMLQAWDLISRRQEMKSVNADDILALFLKSLEHHPFKSYLQTFAWQQAVATEAFAELGQVPLYYWTPATCHILERGRRLRLPDEPLEWIRTHTFIHNSGLVISELAYVMDYAVPEAKKSEWVKYLVAVSPYSPYTIKQQIAYQWDQNQQRVTELLKDYPDADLLIYEIANQYASRFNYPKAEYIYKRMYRKEPNYENIQPLIKLARQEGNSKQELKLLLEGLKLADRRSLQRASQESEIANYFIRQGDYQRALSHARVAARSYSGWGLQVEAECHELLGDLDSARELRKKSAVRYNGQFDFHAWCRSRGLETPPEIQAMLKPYVDYYSKVPLSDERFLVSDQLIYKQLSVVADYLYLEGKLQAALKVFDYSADEYHYVAEAFPAVMAALIADELGLSKERDEYLSQAIAIEFRSRGKSYHLPQINQILLCQRILTGKDSQALSPEVIDWYLQEPPDSQVRLNYRYFIGKALLQKKQNKLAIRYLQQAAESEQAAGFLAAAALHKLKHKPEPRPQKGKQQAAEQGSEDLPDLLDKDYAYGYHKRHDMQLVVLDRAAELFPESSLVLIRRGKLHAVLKQRALAQQDFDKAVKLAPRIPEVWLSRGEFFESTGQDQAAIKDYQQAAEQDPENCFAHQRAALLLSASPDDQARDGKQALQHAQQAMRLLPEKKSENMALLAAAYAELKQFDKAKEYNQNAIKDEKNYRLKKSYQNRQKLYDADKPLRLKKRS